MMDVIKPKDTAITKTLQENGAVFLYSDTGVLRIIPQIGGIIRVSFSSDGVFREEQGKDYSDFSGSIAFEVHENNHEIAIETAEGIVTVNRQTGAVSFYDDKKQLLLTERGDNPRQMEKVSLYRTVNSDKTQVEEIVTADGVKKKIKAADREEYGYAYKTRTFFEFEEDEILLGLGQGEKGEWNLRNTTYYVHQANKKIGIPMLVSSRNYGILLSTSSLIMFQENGKEAFIQTEADFYLDYYFLFGKDLFQVVRNYRRISGKAAMLPLWAYGYIQSKERYKSEQELLETAEEFRKRNIGLDCLVLDWMSWEDNQWGQKSFDAGRFPDPKRMTDELHKKGIRFMMSIWPNMSPGTENNEEFKEKGLLFAGTDIYNAFSEDGRKLYWAQIESALYPAGVDAWWCDSSEPITPEWEHQIEPSDGEKYYDYKKDAESIMPFELANAFGKYHAKAIWDGQRNCTLDRRVVNLTRSGWAGSQKYGTILWSGDIPASWETLDNQIRCGLQIASSGMPYWTLDTGAFFVKKGIQWYWDGKYPNGIDDDYKKLYVRWLEYSAFLPIFRSHGTDVEREPWAFGDCGDTYYEAICETINTRYRLIPYLYSIGAKACINDGMIMRPLLFDFNDDRKALMISDQYMLGDSIMVCPITSPSDKREVYLPQGTAWYDFYTNKRYEGNQIITCECPINRIPVYVKSGSIIPVKQPRCCTDDMKNEDIEVLVYPGSDADFCMYEDAGDGYGYEKGEYCITKFHWNDSEKKLTLSHEGDLRFRQGKIISKFL